MDHKKKKWNDLEVKDKQKYTRSFLRTNFYKSLKGDAKETQSTYCYMILRGVVTTQGSRGELECRGSEPHRLNLDISLAGLGSHVPKNVFPLAVQSLLV